ncbi:MAG: hypothetical protein Ta2E_01060 [Mycoplasmoidaceae bacterium]|nr:MAG: hypothetical protein Ta2E_01060 [Mycoplasmoidaceae bacterium]
MAYWSGRPNGGDINSIRADGQRAFMSHWGWHFCWQFHIKHYFYKTDFLNHIRMLDAVSNTLRNIFHSDTLRMMNHDEIEEAVNI